MKIACAILAISCCCFVTTGCGKHDDTTAVVRDKGSPSGSVEATATIPRSAPISGTPDSDIVTFLGTVTRIGVGGEDRIKRWIVLLKVDEVLSGNFATRTFSFAVHSPSQSGLELGKQYTIQAVRVRDGYQVVEEGKWLGRDPNNK